MPPTPFSDLFTIAQAAPWYVVLGFAVGAFPVWRCVEHLVATVMRRHGERPVSLVAAFALITLGGAPACLAVLGVLGHGAGAISAHFDRPQCTIERFLPDGTSAGVLRLDGPCPASARP